MYKLRFILMLGLFFLLFSTLPHSTLAVGDSWTMYGHDPAHTGRSASNGPITADIKWTYTADGAVSDPVVASNGIIYFTVWLNFYNTTIVALNPNGTLKWEQPSTGSEFKYPTIGTNGNIYLISVTSTGDDFLLALNPSDGSEAWNFNIGDATVIGTNYSHPTVGTDGTVYVASAVGKAGYGTIFAVNPNGTQKWAWDTNQITCGTPDLIYCSIESAPALAPNGNILFKSYSMGLIALNSATGAFVWNTNPGTGDPFYQTFTVGTNNVSYTTEGYGRFNFLAINPNGSTKWTKALDNWNDYGMSALSADETVLYRGDNGGVFYAIFTTNGQIRWRYVVPTDGVAFDGSPVLSANGLIYFTTQSTTSTPDDAHGYVYALRADSGEEVWKYEVGFPGSNLSMGSDGTLYVPGDTPTELGTGNVRMLYAFECADGNCTLPAHNPVHTVTNLNNSGAGSLRQAVTDAMWGDSISFAGGLTGTITLSSPILIERDLTINGPGTSNLTISGGTATRVFSIDPGVSVSMSNLTMSNASFTSSFNYGGAIENLGTLNLSNMVFSNNYASHGGAALYNGGSLTISNTTFSGNHAGSSSSGGAIYNGQNSTLLIQNSTFSANNANSDGGAISNSGTASISNSTFFGNYSVSSVSDGGAIFSNGTLTVINSTFSGNHTGMYGDGGAILNAGTATLKNTIIADNPAFGGQCSGTIVDGGGNLQFPDTDCGATIPTGDPLLTALANNGGPTQTMALQTGSPAIDTGNSVICAASPVNNLDQRGISRLIDGDGNGSAVCDKGAFEAAAVAPPATDTPIPDPPNAAPVSHYFTTDQPTLTWTAISGAIGYEIQVSDSKAFSTPLSFTATTGANELSATTTALSEGVYYWRVHAKKADGSWGAWSVTESFQVDLP